ncbi:hypothetical protein [uncultured Roseibium sp.]|uniref:hypothetical protein n=1 Tax=uncultured Roseibium sp. TaxID=1936171 RepID=UPI00321742F0
MHKAIDFSTNKLKHVGAWTAAIALSFHMGTAWAKDIKYHPNVTLRIGQSIVLKGVRSSNCGTTVPSWSDLSRRLPVSRLGSFSDGGAGTVRSNFCFKRYGIHYVPARAVRFTAKKRGTEKLKIFLDPVTVTVK